MPEPKKIKFFKTEGALRKWFEKNHDKKDELWLGYYKKSSGKPTVTYSQSVDQALCFGWIDGIAKSIDDEKYCQRFTPRKPKSTWSAVNIKKIEDLRKNGLMHTAGLQVFNERDVTKTNRYSFEQEKIKLTAVQEKLFKKNKTAWKNFNSMPPGYRKTAVWWVISAVKEETRTRRLEVLIKDSKNGLRIKELRRNDSK